MQVIKRDGTSQQFDPNKIKNAILKAFDSCCPLEDTNIIDTMIADMYLWDGMSIEEIQDVVIETLRDYSVLVKDLYKQKYFNEIENECLAELRDFLLPMLMNGQVSVS